jgi:hypothetical protein
LVVEQHTETIPSSSTTQRSRAGGDSQSHFIEMLQQIAWVLITISARPFKLFPSVSTGKETDGQCGGSSHSQEISGTIHQRAVEVEQEG